MRNALGARSRACHQRPVPLTDGIRLRVVDGDALRVVSLVLAVRDLAQARQTLCDRGWLAPGQPHEVWLQAPEMGDMRWRLVDSAPLASGV